MFDLSNFTQIINLLNSQYAIFLSDTYFSSFKFFLHKYLKKYNITIIHFSHKDIISQLVNNYNYFIKTSCNDDKKKFINELKKNYNISIQKLKYINFSDIQPNVLYKKIFFSNEELFLSFEEYIFKHKEYKLRTFCQVAEKLGAINIKISDNLKSNDEIPLLSSINDINYSANNVFTLNKFHIIQLIHEENEFHITKNDFDKDVDLKFLIDARCINLMNKYYTTILINPINTLEKKIISKSKKYGLKLGLKKLDNYVNKVFIEIDFINIYDNPESIDGFNIYNMKEGFGHLSNIIKILCNEKINLNSFKSHFLKIYNFLESHLKTLEILNNNNLTKSFYNILNNFNKEEQKDLFFDNFFNKMTYNNFLYFRDIIIKEPTSYFNKTINIIGLIQNIIDFQNNTTDKLFFISYQYHKINNFKNTIMEKIYGLINEDIHNLKSRNDKSENIEDIINGFLNLKSFYITCNNNLVQLEELNEEKDYIFFTKWLEIKKNFKNTILIVFSQLFKIKNGLFEKTSKKQILLLIDEIISLKNDNSPEYIIKNVCYLIIKYLEENKYIHFENKIINLIKPNINNTEIQSILGNSHFIPIQYEKEEDDNEIKSIFDITIKFIQNLFKTYYIKKYRIDIKINEIVSNYIKNNIDIYLNYYQFNLFISWNDLIKMVFIIKLNIEQNNHICAC